MKSELGKLIAEKKNSTVVSNPVDDGEHSTCYVDVTRNRNTRRYTRREYILRVLWAATVPLFRITPRPLWGVRNFYLRLFGAKVGQGSRIYPSVRILMPWNISFGDQCTVGWDVKLYALGELKIGDRVTISQYVHICGGTHDIHSPDRPLVKSPITIGDDVWIAADAFVGPNVKVGRGAIVGARAVVTKDVVDNSIVIGNPARKL